MLTLFIHEYTGINMQDAFLAAHTAGIVQTQFIKSENAEQDLTRGSVDLFQKRLTIGFGNGNHGFTDMDPVAFNGFDFIERHHIRLMYPADLVRRQFQLQLTKGLQGHNLFVQGMYAPVIPHPFYKTDIAE